ncbi:hypothetical protein EYC84_005930 [Monilinia fructicola]|nr:hypothetical protein EYC84_005930 [Monilinia fructicola]
MYIIRPLVPYKKSRKLAPGQTLLSIRIAYHPLTYSPTQSLTHSLTTFAIRCRHFKIPIVGSYLAVNSKPLTLLGSASYSLLVHTFYLLPPIPYFLLPAVLPSSAVINCSSSLLVEEEIVGMKYGQKFQLDSVPEWAPYNLDYDELKDLIKKNTTRDSGKSIAIPGHVDTTLLAFENEFFTELSNQHDRVELFVKSKSEEIGRRLQYLSSLVLRLLARCAESSSGHMTRKRMNKFSKYNAQVESCGEDLAKLDRFVEAQRVAFYKLLKKYTKWTGSRALKERFDGEILGNPKSFTRQDFGSLHSQYNDLITLLRTSTPVNSGPSTPSLGSRRESLNRVPSHTQRPSPQRQAYWNEYDNGSDVDQDEPYYIYADPNAEMTFPGAEVVASAIRRTKQGMEMVRDWFVPSGSLKNREREALLGNRDGRCFERSPIGTANGSETDVEEDAYASSADFPGGYVTHYATFPSVADQRLSRFQEQTLLFTMLACFFFSALSEAASTLLLATGRHKLRTEVDLGALMGALLGLCLAAGGLICMACRNERLGWVHRGVVFITTTVLLIGSIILLVMTGR